MKTNSYDRYTKFADEYVENGFIPPKRHLNKGEQQVIAIHQLLSDGEWRTAKEVMAHLNLSSKCHVQNVLRSLINPLAIASGQQGYCIPNKNTILIA